MVVDVSVAKFAEWEFQDSRMSFFSCLTWWGGLIHVARRWF